MWVGFSNLSDLAKHYSFLRTGKMTEKKVALCTLNINNFMKHQRCGKSWKEVEKICRPGDLDCNLIEDTGVSKQKHCIRLQGFASGMETENE